MWKGSHCEQEGTYAAVVPVATGLAVALASDWRVDVCIGGVQYDGTIRERYGRGEGEKMETGEEGNGCCELHLAVACLLGGSSVRELVQLSVVIVARKRKLWTHNKAAGPSRYDSMTGRTT